jgi:hypothetical protein
VEASNGPKTLGAHTKLQKHKMLRGNKPYKRLNEACGRHKLSLGIYTRMKHHKNTVRDKDSKLSYMFIAELT